MRVPTIAPMTSVLEMKRNGLRIRQDAIGLNWKVVKEPRIEQTSMSHVRQLLQLCISQNCGNYHRGISIESITADLSTFETIFGETSTDELVNAASLSELFKDFWKSEFKAWKLMVLRFRWNKFLLARGAPQVVMRAPDISDAISGAATKALAVLDTFGTFSKSIIHKEGFLNEIGSVQVRFHVHLRAIHVSFFALVSGREKSGIYLPRASPEEFMSQLLGIPKKTTGEVTAPVKPGEPEMTRFKRFLQHLFDDVLDMEDHRSIERRQRQQGQKEIAAARAKKRTFQALSLQGPVLVFFMCLLALTFWNVYE